MRDGEDDGREGRKWTRPGIKSSGVAVEWMRSTCCMNWLKSCPLYSHPIHSKQEYQPSASRLYFATSYSIHPKGPWNLPPKGHLAETNFICKTNTC